MSSSLKPSGSLILDMVLKVDGDQQEAFLQHGMTIGRAASNTICIDSPDVEHIHARVLRGGDGKLYIRAETATARLGLMDGGNAQQIELGDQTRFRIGPKTLVCIKQQTRTITDVVVTDNPWRIKCPVCYRSIAQLPVTENQCPHCSSPLVYFRTAEGAQFDGWLPRRVGPYNIRAYVGRGGMGVVLRGLHSETDSPAAIKLMRFAETSDLTKRFLLEADTLKNLKHPNIVTLQQHGQDNKMLWLAMDWIDGQVLTALIAQARTDSAQLPTREVTDILTQTARGLHYLHANGIVHRDLKPQNILRSRDNLVKIVDFGLALQQDKDVSMATMLTQTGMVVGTAGYMSPEQLGGEKLTTAADMFCLGLIAYELFTGKRLLGVMDSLVSHRSDCPAGWQELIAACLNTNPGLRPSAQEFLDRVKRIEDGVAWPNPTVQRPVPPRPPKSRPPTEDVSIPNPSPLPPRPVSNGSKGPIRNPPVETTGGKLFGCLSYFLLVCGLGIILFGIGKTWGESSLLPALVLIVGTSIWAAIDAVRLKTYKYEGYNGPIATCFACLVLWIFIFPYYLIKRRAIVNGTAKYSKKKFGWLVESISIIILSLILAGLSWIIFQERGTEENTNTLDSSPTRSQEQASPNITRLQSNAISRDFSFVQDADEKMGVQFIYNSTVATHAALMRASAEYIRVVRGESDRFTPQEIDTILQNITTMEVGGNLVAYVAELDNAGVPQLPGHILEDISDIHYKSLELAYYRIRDNGQEANDAWVKRNIEEEGKKQQALAMEFHNAPQNMTAGEYVERSVAITREGL